MVASFSGDRAPRALGVAGTVQDRKARDPRPDAAPPEVSPPVPRTTLLKRMRSPRPPRLWFEVMLLALCYWTYSLIRNSVPEQEAEALRNAQSIWSFQKDLGLAFELGVNHALEGITWLIVSMNYYYAILHFAVTLTVLAWLYRHHPGRYAATRMALFATTGVALVGYYLYPLAPPRLMAGVDFVDTVREHETLGSMASGNLANVSNQYAAMPSMHIGWALWCGVTIAVLAGPLWLKVVGGLYPAMTLLVIVATANHFWMDAVGGIACLGFGFGMSYAWYGTSAYRLPRRVGAPPGRAAGYPAEPPAR